MAEVAGTSEARDELAIDAATHGHLGAGSIVQAAHPHAEELERDALGLPFGRLLLLRDRTARYVSPRGRLQIDSGDGLELENGRLVATGTRADASMARALDLAWSQPAAATCHMVLRPSGKSPWALRIRMAARANGDQVAEVHIVDTALQTSPPADLLAVVYGLTPSEAAVLERLLLGESIAEVAKATGRAVSTTRLRVERVLRKTGSHRQAELLLRSVWPLVAWRS